MGLTAYDLMMAGSIHNSFNEVLIMNDTFFNGWEDNSPPLSKWDQFAQDKPNLAAYLLDVRSWNDFAASLVYSINKYGSLTERQLASLLKMHDKHLARQKEQAKPAEKVDLSRVSDLFATAFGSQIKHPKFRCGDLVLLPSKKDDRIFVKEGPRYEDTYFGSVNGDGSFRPARGCPDWVLPRLKTLAADPLKDAQAYGQKTGNCSCCGRQLTNADSIALGIGPICKGRWGL